MSNAPHDLRNLIIAILLSGSILFAWQYFYVMPQQRELARIAALKKAEEEKNTAFAQPKTVGQPGAYVEKVRTREDIIAESKRVKVTSPRLHGSIALKGLRLDDLTLANYRQELAADSSEVVLLSPAGTEQAYFAEFGWLSGGQGNMALPGPDTVWTADRNALTPEQPVTFTWNNGQGLQFALRVALDKDYMFTLTRTVTNASGQAVTLLPYGFVNRAYPNLSDNLLIQHDGPLGVLDGALKEVHYKNLRDDGPVKLENAQGWLGITDKYWLTAMVPAAASMAANPSSSAPSAALSAPSAESATTQFTANFSHYKAGGQERYQVDYLGAPRIVDAGQKAEDTTHFFAGAKEIKLLDAYAAQYNIPLFDRAVDLGMLYFLTKPLFLMLTYFYGLVGNFGVAILLMTVVVKLLMYPLANKSYIAMSAMKALQPEMMKLRERYPDDKVRMNQELMALYKREKVNPLAGCLPILVQLPVFFALYKVLYVTIEMRHAPFFGWIHDLSAIDPTNIFTLFGVLDWSTPAFLHIGIWPLIMTATMVIQQKLNPAPTDPVQAKVMAWMPWVFLFLFASFPAGLVIYWAWSNVLSILQQWMITRRYNATRGKHTAIEATATGSAKKSGKKG